MKGTITNTKIKKKLMGRLLYPVHLCCNSILTTAGKRKRATLFPSEHIILTTHFLADSVLGRPEFLQHFSVFFSQVNTHTHTHTPTELNTPGYKLHHRKSYKMVLCLRLPSALSTMSSIRISICIYRVCIYKMVVQKGSSPANLSTKMKER